MADCNPRSIPLDKGFKLKEDDEAGYSEDFKKFGKSLQKFDWKFNAGDDFCCSIV